MAHHHPTTGGLRLPAAQVHLQTIDLDLLPSDGDPGHWHNNDPLFDIADPDAGGQAWRATFGHQADLQALFGGMPFQTCGLPDGYQVEHRVYNGRREMRIYGHPGGHYFKSWVTWGVHLSSLMKEDLPRCTCVLCGGWRAAAPANAAINVGLPLVAGGAVAAALAGTIAREEQKRREEEATRQSIDLLVRASEVDDLPEWQVAVIQAAVQEILRRRR